MIALVIALLLVIVAALGGLLWCARDLRARLEQPLRILPLPSVSRPGAASPHGPVR